MFGIYSKWLGGATVRITASHTGLGATRDFAMRILHLTLKKKWFDMIASGEKTEEYREIKPYWNKRLHKTFHTHIRFRNGYRKDAPVMLVDMRGLLTIGYGNTLWGAPEDEMVYILRLGNIIEDAQ